MRLKAVKVLLHQTLFLLALYQGKSLGNLRDQRRRKKRDQICKWKYTTEIAYVGLWNLTPFPWVSSLKSTRDHRPNGSGTRGLDFDSETLTPSIALIALIAYVRSGSRRSSHWRLWMAMHGGLCFCVLCSLNVSLRKTQVLLATRKWPSCP